jgi:hypothetical protein
LAQRVRHAVSDLLSRPWTTGLNAASVAVAVLSLLVLGFVGWSLYRYRDAVLNESPVTRIGVSAKDPTDPDGRFSEERIAELAARVGAVRGFPKVEVGGQVWRNPDAPAAATVEGTVADDPTLAPGRLAWGRAAESGSEAVAPLGLFQKLGGKLTRAGGPSDTRLTLEVRRTTGGREEAHAVVLEIVGLNRAADGKLFVPLPLAVALDRWCAHAADGVTGTEGKAERPRFSPAAVLAFGPAAFGGRVAGDTRHLNTTVRTLGEVTPLGSPEAVWLAMLRLRPSAPLTEATMAYALTPKSQAPDAGAELLAGVRLARPTFSEALPLLRVTARCGRETIQLEATTASDPRRFAAAVLRGTWPTEHGGEVVLPAALVAKVFPNEPPAACVGRELTLTFERDDAAHDFDRTLTLPVRLACVTWDGKGGFVSAELAVGVTLWAAGKVVHSTTRKAFESPAVRYERAGFARCNLDMADATQVARAVGRLQAEGYSVSHRLGELQGQQRLGRVLAVVVAVLVGGYLLSGLITVFASNAQQVASKVYEIGVLRSLGMGRREVVSLFAIQGFVTGLAAFLLGTVAAVCVEPLVSRTLISACGLPAEVLPRRLAGASFSALFGVALGLAVASSVFGAVVPAIRAARLDLVDSMRRTG